jgi:D-alanyl-D-alanine carboxypeptidase/D-alanyl-D-alanine-endopeptidase (penicillin-binding protein 4)
MLYERSSKKLLMPASNMKIVTLAAAADALGWDYTFETRVVAAGRIAGGTLQGDLVVVGGGDPSIGLADGSAERVFADWARALSDRGIHTIAGRIVGDDNAFDEQTLGFGWSWDDLPDDYAAGIGALQFNENAVRINVAAGPAPGEYAAITVEPAAGVDVVGLARTGAAGSATSLSTKRLPGSQRLEISGTIAAGATPATLMVAVDNPTLFFVQSLRRALVAHGIDVHGPAVDMDGLSDPPAIAGTAPMLSHRSAPLSTLAIRLMKSSQNQYAETLLKALGAENGSEASAIAGRAAVTRILERWGVQAGGLIQRDGSGLSRYDYLTADALVTILAHIHADPRLREPFTASLPIAGGDGTLGNRLKGTPAEGNVRAKTGSMSNVRGLSGYLTTAGGEPLAFSILANNFAAADVVNKATDAIVLRLLKQ